MRERGCPCVSCDAEKFLIATLENNTFTFGNKLCRDKFIDTLSEANRLRLSELCDRTKCGWKGCNGYLQIAPAESIGAFTFSNTYCARCGSKGTTRL